MKCTYIRLYIFFSYLSVADIQIIFGFHVATAVRPFKFIFLTNKKIKYLKYSQRLLLLRFVESYDVILSRGRYQTPIFRLNAKNAFNTRQFSKRLEIETNKNIKNNITRSWTDSEN